MHASEIIKEINNLLTDFSRTSVIIFVDIFAFHFFLLLVRFTFFQSLNS